RRVFTLVGGGGMIAVVVLLTGRCPRRPKPAEVYPMPLDPQRIRQDFPVVQQTTYLASASVTPSPAVVTQAGVDFVRAKGSIPYELEDMLAQTETLRSLFAQLVNARLTEVGLIYTTSEAENMVVRALGLQQGDNIVTDDLHYSASYVIYEQLAAQGVEIRIAKRLPDGSAPPAVFAPLMDRGTRLVSVAWISHQTGYRHDLAGLAELAHAHGAYLYADIIQGVGMLPLDLAASGVDFCAAGSYKWLLGSFGVALFYVRESRLELIPPDRFGFFHVLGKTGPLSHELPSDARKFMYATPAFGPVYQLSAGIQYVLDVGVAEIAEYVIGLAHYLRAELKAQGFQIETPAGNQSAIVAFRHGLDPAIVQKRLSEADIHVNFREGGTQIRIGSALFNVQAELDAFLAVMKELKG
ncbi:MAG: aminotransferase class V-fold PLP-dependent enzyme, partial [Anaerolineales bacterium]|nr:aminotransferase class V-fold PLP-dependent enzyme [Anaerolineales bacterium]